MGLKNNGLGVIYTQQMQEKFQKRKLLYILFTSCILIAITVQSALWRFTESFSDSLGALLKEKFEENCLSQMIAAPIMIVLQIFACVLPARYARGIRIQKLCRLVLQLAYVVFFIEITVIPLTNSGNSSLMVPATLFFIELLMLNFGFMIFETPGFENVAPLALANLLLAVRCKIFQAKLTVPFIIIILIEVIIVMQSHKIEKVLFEKHDSSQNDEEIYHAFFNLLPEGVAILADGEELKYANSSLYRILGCDQWDEQSILNRLLSLSNVDEQKDESGVKKPEFKLEFQKLPENMQENHSNDSKKLDFKKKSLAHNRSLQAEDLLIEMPEANAEIHSHDLELAKNKLKQRKRQTFHPIFNRANTYDVTHKKPSSDSMSELKSVHTIQLNANSNSIKMGEDSAHLEKDKSYDKESILRSARNTGQNRVEHPYLATVTLNERESEMISEDKRSGNVTPKAGRIGHNTSFIRKKTFQIERKLSSEISFVGPIRATQLGQPSGQIINNSSQSYNPKTPRSQLNSQNGISGSCTPKSIKTGKVSFDNLTQPKNSPQYNSAQQRSASPGLQISPDQAPQGETPLIILPSSSRQMKNSKTAHFFQTLKTFKTLKKSESIRHEPEKEKKKDKKLTSYITTLSDIGLAYQSLMRRLKSDAKTRVRSSSPRPTDCGYSPSFFHTSFFSKIKKYLFRKKNTHTVLQQTAENTKETEIRLNIDEENYCIIMNSKLKISEDQEKSLEIKLTPTLLNGMPLILVLVKDMTERDLINRLKETNNYKNTIMASVSHELKTPLNCILAMQEMLRPYISEELAVQYLNPAINSSKLLMSLVNDILDFGQIRAGMHKHYYEVFSLKEVLQDALTLFEIPAKNRDLELKFEYDSTIPKLIHSDPTRIRQIVVNLLNNAIKFTYKGSITLKAASKGPKQVCIGVTDTGVGIKAENVKQIFSAFGKLENDHLNPQGVGLGLTISQSLASRLGPKDHKGIKVESEFGKGSRFYFTIEYRRVKNTMMDQMKELAEGEEEERERDQEERKTHREPEEEKKRAEDMDVCEIEDTSGEETMRPGFNMGMLNRMALNAAEHKNNYLKGSFQSYQSLDSQNGGSGTYLPDGSVENVTLQKDVTDAVLLHQQRAVDMISLQLNHQAIPLKLVSPIRFSSRLNVSFQLQTPSNNGELVQQDTTAYINQPCSSHMELFSISADTDQTKSPLFNKTDNANPIKTSDDVPGRLKLLGSSFLVKSKDVLPVTPTNDKKKTIKSAHSPSMDLLRGAKSNGDVGSSNNISTKISKTSLILFQNQKNCTCEDILIVDDNDFNLLALKQILESFQFSVATAHNGEIAINIIKEKAQNPCCKAFHLVFMDCDMPVKDGFETTIELRALQKAGKLPAFPIIAATAFVNEREVNRCFECGMDEYMNKPVKKEKIAEMIKKYYKR